MTFAITVRRFGLIAALACLLLLSSPGTGNTVGAVSDSKTDALAKASRYERNGWIYIHLEGSPEEIGYQHGYLLAREIDESLQVFKKYLPRTTKRDWQFYRNAAHELFWKKIGDEYQKEIQGIASGAYARGVRIDSDDVLAMNGWIELASYYVPSLLQARLDDPELHQSPPPSCSAFIATGSWTRDGGIVIGHNNWVDYVIGRRWNIIVDLKPAAGNRILMDSFPGFIHSGDDFYITNAGLMVTETTITQFKGFDTEGLPEFYRIRKATQYSNSIDDWLKVMMDRPNGGYSNDWLVGDRKTGEIARLENGLKNNIVERTRDGFYVGANFPVHEKTTREETTFDPNNAANSANARHRRWDELMKLNKGKIDINLAKKFEADHYDVVRKRPVGSGNTLCGHVEADELGLPEWDWKNYYPGGTVNAKVADNQLAEKMSFWGSVGHPCGSAFKLDQFLKAHPDYEWQRAIGGDRPGGPWTLFTIAGQKLGDETSVKGIHTKSKNPVDAARRQRDDTRNADPTIRPVETRPPQ
ncbi:MAG TPA: C45 family peptidase [Blastocatellia bacterium]|nr:C45 family peptidase [Blastocatellia bacterium]